MGRPPCCDKEGVKKGPWTREEDLVLVSYVQEHGPGNWRAVPANTGLMRCSKSCRLRWTNYLRPGIRRGGFSDQEDKLIVHLQALLGNRWAAIASYLPDRTDNDVKNYWNTHLRKKLALLTQQRQRASPPQPPSRGQWEHQLQTDIGLARRALRHALSADLAAPAAAAQAPCARTAGDGTLLDGWAAAPAGNDKSRGGVGGIIVPVPPAAAPASASSELTECSGSISSQLMVRELPPLSVIESWLLEDDGGEQ